jgi:DNA-binding transcriptional ArsR family regulator
MMTHSDAIGIAEVAALIGHPARAAILVALLEQERLPTTDLAKAAAISASTASIHLSKLRSSGLVTWEAGGRVHYYRLANPRVAAALDAFGELLPARPRGSTGAGSESRDPDRLARMCYDHVAGRLGVSLLEALLHGRFVSLDEVSPRPVRGQAYGLTKKGFDLLRSFGLGSLRPAYLRRSFAHACLDRTERRSHLGGTLGAAIARRLFDLKWIERTGAGRGLAVTPKGRSGLRATFGLGV